MGPTTGVVETTVSEIRVDLKPVESASKGVYCSIPIDFSKDTDTLREAADAATRLRRSDKVYIWAEE